VPGGGYGGVAGIILILTGTAMVAIAAVRFIHSGRTIDSAEPNAGSTRLEVMLAGLIVLPGTALLVYLAHTLVTGL
jgi:uncharacterized membrane protein YidH (DUF202 family)